MSLAQQIKTRIVVLLNELVTSGLINSVYSTDQGKNPLTMDPPGGYPFAIIGMPSVTSDYEDQANNVRIYSFDVMVIQQYDNLKDPTIDVEGTMDALMNKFDQLANLTLQGAAEKAVLPIEIVARPVSTADKTFVVFLATIRAQAIFQTNP